MSITYHERPGVYSSYDASSITASGTARRVIAVIGASSAAAGVYTLTSFAGAAEVFGEDSALWKLLKLAYQNGAGTVLAYPVAADTAAADSSAAFSCAAASAAACSWAACSWAAASPTLTSMASLERAMP